MGGRAKPTSRRATGEQRGSSRACVWERSAKHASNGVAKLAAQCPKWAKPPRLRFLCSKGTALCRRARATERFKPNPPSTPAPPNKCECCDCQSCCVSTRLMRRVSRGFVCVCRSGRSDPQSGVPPLAYKTKSLSNEPRKREGDFYPVDMPSRSGPNPRAGGWGSSSKEMRE